MMTERRLTPEKLLARAQKEALKELKGKLKIFFGAAPGVGKTYAMLEDAKGRLDEGLDVVAGVVESHGRIDTDQLLQQLEKLPLQTIDYRGKNYVEFDIDKALARSPALILVDEMAHTNIPGARHTKRWQDIKELLDRGIDVYTTLNVQHVESLNDVLLQITGVKVHETIPDSILDLADTIELIDLPPDDLLKRLQEGKVYLSQQAELARENFFRPGNLTALRELALRYTAEQVNTQVLLHRQGQAAEQIWPTSERLLVCVGPGEGSAKLIRSARRMAANLHVDWITVFVDSPRLHLSENERKSAMQNLRLSAELGAEAQTLTGQDLVKEIINFARERNVTRILMLKKITSRWRDFIFGSLVDELIRHSGEIEIFIVPAEENIKEQRRIFNLNITASWMDYLQAIVIVMLCTVVNFLLYPYLQVSNLIMVYLIGVVAVAAKGQQGPAILSSFLSVLTFDFFFIPPQFSFAVSDVQYFITLIVMLLVSQLISHLTIVIKRQAQLSRLHARRTSAMYSLSRKLATQRGIDQVLQIAVKFISELFDSDVYAIMPDENKQLVIRAGSTYIHELDSKEQSIAQWVFELGQPAGLGTQTLSYSRALYLPLTGVDWTVGVLRIEPKDASRFDASESMHLLETCVHQIALALEVDRLEEEKNRHKV